MSDSPNAQVVGRIAIKVMPDTSDFRRQLKADLSKIEKSARLDIKAQLDASAFERQARDSARDSKRSMERTLDDVRAEIHTDVNAASRAASQANLTRLTRTRVVEILPRVNEVAAAKAAATLAALSGTRALSTAFGDFADLIGNLDKSLPKIAGLSLGIADLTTGLLAGTSNALAYSASLAQIGGTALALPGILGGVAIGIGSTVAVLKDFNEVIPEASKALSRLQDQMSARFWAQAEAPIRGLSVLFPEIRRNLLSTSDALGDFFGNLAGSAVRQLAGQFDAMFADLIKSIRIAAQSTDAYVDIIKRLGTVGASMLPDLATWVAEVAEGFSEWLGRKGTAGLRAYVTDGVAALQDLGNVLRYTGSSLAGLARAAEAAGGGSLKTLANSLKSVSDEINSPAFQRDLTGVFRSAHEAMQAITSTSGPAFRSLIRSLADLLTTVLPQAGATTGAALRDLFSAIDQPAVTSALVYAFDQLDVAIGNITPALPSMGKALAAIAVTVADLGAGVSSALGPALDFVSEALVDLSADLRPLIGSLTDLVSTLVSGAGPVLVSTAGLLGNIAGSITPVVDGLNATAEALGAVLGPAQGAAAALGGIAVVAGGAAFLGTALRGKILAASSGMASLAASSRIAEQAMFRTALATERAALRITPLRAGLAGIGLASATMADKVGLSNTAIGASIGLLGGPWGVAIGAAAGYVADLTVATNAGGRSLEEYTRALRNGVAAFSFAEYTAGIKGMEQSLLNLEGTLSRAQLAAPYFDQQRDAITGANASLTVYAQAFTSLGNALGVAVPEFDGSAASIRALDAAVAQMLPALDLAGVSVTQLAMAQRIANGDAGLLSGAFASQKPPLDSLIGSIQKAAGVQRDEAAAVRDAIAARQEYTNAALSAFSATTRWGQAVADANRHLKDTRKGISENTASGRANRQVIDALAQAWNAGGEQVRNTQGRYKSAREEFIRVTAALTGSKREARALADDLLVVPDRMASAGEGARRLRKNLEDLDRTKVEMPNVERGVTTSIRVAENKAFQGSKAIKENIEREIKRARADLSQLQASIRNAINQAKSIATSGGRQVGANLKAGIIAGFAGTAAALATQAAGAVRAAIAAAKAAGAIRSPSRKMMEVGGYLADGLVVGMRRKAGDVKKAAGGVVKGAVNEGITKIYGVSDGIARAIGKAIDEARGKVRKKPIKTDVQVNFGNPIKAGVLFVGGLQQYLKAITDKVGVEGVKLIRNFEDRLNRYRDLVKERMKQVGDAADAALVKQRKGITELSNRYTKLVSELERVRNKYKQLQQEARDYANQVRDAVIASANPTQIQLEEGQKLDFSVIESNMSKARDEALEFAAVVKSLAAAGLNKDLLQQIVDAGPTAGLETARQIFLAGKEGIKSLNAIQKDLEIAGKDLGKTAAISVFGASIIETGRQLSSLETQFNKLKPKLEKSLTKLMNGLIAVIKAKNKELKAELAKAEATANSKSGSVSSASTTKTAAARVASAGGGQVIAGPTLIYNASGGASLTAEEQLFTAADRGRLLLTA
ncbi:hypothetical protein [Nocardioides sp. R-C-SC26]|uniref:hypothetical protein n=1 Tax=Nocardioides sp. R-C-SC26 TaxID=2870414 RepID=UPI001E48A4CE|nr:hypothetical protein [Nocardioides sp. R-C-SC26]